MKEKASLTLSGGGGLGVAHIGALSILENKFYFDYYSGVSAGAIIVAAHACGYKAEEISKIVHKQKFLSYLWDKSHTNYGIIHGTKIFNLLKDIFKNKKIEDLQTVKLKIFATNFETGIRHCFTSGSIAHAVMSSLSLPVILDPFFYENKFFVDGGLSGNFPIQDTLDNYKGKCIGIDVATCLKKEEFGKKTFFGKPKGLQNSMERMFRIFFKSQQNFNENHKNLVLLTPNLSTFKTIDIFKLKEIEKVGKDYVKSFLKIHNY
jgi:NTE family protein